MEPELNFNNVDYFTNFEFNQIEKENEQLRMSDRRRTGTTAMSESDGSFDGSTCNDKNLTPPFRPMASILSPVQKYEKSTLICQEQFLWKPLFQCEQLDEFIKKLKTMKGSIFYQKALDSQSINIHFLFKKLEPYFIELMCSQYGNYFIQKLLPLLSLEERLTLFKIIENDFVAICMDPSGTHSIQGLIEVIKTPLEERILENLMKDNIIKFIFNENANHTIQKILIEYPQEKKEFLVNYMLENIEKICVNQLGILCTCKLIIATSEPNVKSRIVQVLSSNNVLTSLISSQNGSSIIFLAMEKFGVQYFTSFFKKVLEKDTLLFYATLNENSVNFIEGLFKFINKTDRSFFLNYLFSLINPNGGFVKTLISLEIGKKLLFNVLMIFSPQHVEFFIQNYRHSSMAKAFCIELSSYISYY